MLAACDIVCYYETVGRELTPSMLTWPVIKNFREQLDALKQRKKDGTDFEVPKITKSVNILKWSESFKDFLSRKIGSRLIPYSYVVRKDVNVGDALALATGHCYSTEHNSVEGELVARVQHTHAKYRDNNQAVYYFLEEATHNTSYAALIKPYQRNRDGRATFNTMTSQYTGEDK